MPDTAFDMNCAHRLEASPSPGSAVVGSSPWKEESLYTFKPAPSCDIDETFHEIKVEAVDPCCFKMETEEIESYQSIRLYGIQENVPDVLPQEATGKKFCNTHNNCNVLGLRNRRRKSVQSFLCFLRACSAVAVRTGAHILHGPIRLATCPRCSLEFKNVHDRLLRIARHILARHKQGSDILLKDIMSQYKPQILFMEKKFRVLMG